VKPDGKGGYTADVCECMRGSQRENGVRPHQEITGWACCVYHAFELSETAYVSAHTHGT